MDAKELLGALNLPDDATIDQVKAFAERPEMDRGEDVVKALGLDETATASDIVDAVSSLRERVEQMDADRKAAQAAESKAKGAEAQVEKLEQRIAEMEQQSMLRAAKERVDPYLKDGTLAAEEADDYVKLALTEPKMFERMIVGRTKAGKAVPVGGMQGTRGDERVEQNIDNHAARANAKVEEIMAEKSCSRLEAHEILVRDKDFAEKLSN